jgi:hypothetical protein
MLRTKVNGFGGFVRAAAARGLKLRLLGAVGLAGTTSMGCQGDQHCEAARLELAQTWEGLRNTATSRKQIPEGADLSKSEEAERIRIWSEIEDRAELLRSSFQTPQVTWPSADKARTDLGHTFSPLATSQDPMTRGFAVTLAEADKRLETFRKSCR